MATIKPVVLDSANLGGGIGSGTLVVEWTPITEADTCASFACGGFANKSVQVVGTFGGSTTVIQGSNEPMTTADASADFASLRNSTHTAISLTATGLEEILENTLRIRPSSSGGSSQSLTVWLFLQTPARR